MKKGIIIAFGDEMWEPESKEVFDSIRKISDKEPLYVYDVLQAILEKNKIPGCRVSGTSIIGGKAIDTHSIVFVECNDSVKTRDIINWLDKSVDEAKRISKYGNIKDEVTMVVKEILQI